MLLGCGKSEIRLPEGFLPSEGFTAQAHPLYARALLLGGETPFLLISVEMTSLPDRPVSLLREAAASRAGLPAENVWIAVTHTFSAPHIAPDDGAHPGSLLAAVLDAVLAAVGQTLNDLREAELSISVGESAVPASRDIELPEGWWVGCGGAGETDRTLSVLRGETAGMTRLILVHLSVQPSVLDQTGAAKYMPHLSAYAQCRYEAQNSPFMPGCAEALTDRVLAMLREAAQPDIS